MNGKVIIIGAGGHAKVVADAVRKSGATVLGFLDDNASNHGQTFAGSIILGAVADYKKYADDASFVIGIGSGETRKRISELLDGVQWHTVIHPSAVIAEGVVIGEGAFVGALAVINPDTEIGKHTILNTGAIVEHDCVVGDYTHMAPAATLCGGSSVGDLCWVGAGSTVIHGIEVHDDVIIGAGATVIRNIEECGTYVGTPARKL
jgi:sugar O-acyltransferase (sialic acid O-acetyltransferase NeuD family)